MKMPQFSAYNSKQGEIILRSVTFLFYTKPETFLEQKTFVVAMLVSPASLSENNKYTKKSIIYKQKIIP